MNIKHFFLQFLYFRLGLHRTLVTRINYDEITTVRYLYIVSLIKTGLINTTSDLKKWLPEESKEFKKISERHLGALNKNKITSSQRLLLTKNWNGINDYLHMYGMEALASSHVFFFKEVPKKNYEINYLVSVIITTYNSSKTIERAVSSLLNQSYKHIEIIIIDDASTDNTEEIVNSIKNDNIRYIKNRTNIGTYASRNKALKCCNGQYITTLDADDVAYPKRIEIQMNLMLKDRTLKACVGDWIRFTESGIVDSSRGLPIQRLCLNSLLVKREVFDKIGLWDDTRIGGDLEFYHRIKLYYGKKSIFRQRSPLNFGLVSSGSLTGSSKTGIFSKDGKMLRIEYEEKWRINHLKHRRFLYYLIRLFEK